MSKRTEADRRAAGNYKLTIRLSEEQLDDIAELSELTERPKSYIIKESLARYSRFIRREMGED